MGLYYRIFHPRRMEYYSANRENGCDYPGSNSSTARLANKDEQMNTGNTKQMNDINRLLTQGLTVNYHDKIPGK